MPAKAIPMNTKTQKGNYTDITPAFTLTNISCVFDSTTYTILLDISIFISVRIQQETDINALKVSVMFHFGKNSAGN
jgi:hypothetical protein